VGQDNRNERQDIRDVEDQEWIDSLDYVFENEGPERVGELLRLLQSRAGKYGVEFYCPSNTPFVNTIPASEEVPFPGSREVERRIKSLVRWNAMAMVVRANKELDGIGGHISSYASAATLWEVGFNHFFRGKNHPGGGDTVYFQGHASPGVYARSFIEGRLQEQDLQNFRRELRPEGGLSSYPHPRLMPEYWEMPTVSMGLAPIMAIYQARFNRYLADRGVKDTSKSRIWALLGDGEMDEPEAMGAITLAARENLDNLTFVVNCNLQRLDGPVRGNGKIIQELEAAFRGAGWNVIKVIWGSDWDPLLAQDEEGLLVRRMNEVVDGQAQKYSVSSGDYVRQDFFGKYPQLLEMVKSYSDEQLYKLRRGGHDPVKVYNAFKRAAEHTGQPTVILAQTIKGYGLGEAGEGRNITHQQKKLNQDELREFRARFGIPIADDTLPDAPFYRPPEDSEEMEYLKGRREELGGYLPKRESDAEPLPQPKDEVYQQFWEGLGEREVATTMVFVQLLREFLSDKEIGSHVVPIVPDEARTFGMEALFRQSGIYSHVGQNYEPVDKDSLLYYNEQKNGAILEEGITEAGSMSSFIAAGTAYATHGINMVPFFIFYSMFGFQRIGDLIWAAGDAQAKGFLVGGTSGRTTLPGEGLQHQDGQSHLLSYSVPCLKAYDPTFAYEIATIVKDGIQRMYVDQDPLIYYITVMNEFYQHPPMPEGSTEGILKGLYRLQGPTGKKKARAHLFGSGTILIEAIKAKTVLEQQYGIPTAVYSATSYKELYLDGTRVDRWNRLHPDEEQKTTHVADVLSGEKGAVVAATDYLKAVPASVAPWVPLPMTVLGTDGFGRSDGRQSLRDYFEVDTRFIAFAAIKALADSGDVDTELVSRAMNELTIDPEKINPVDV
jgi:pyruvate dehydrogenase E1 component